MKCPAWRRQRPVFLLLLTALSLHVGCFGFAHHKGERRLSQAALDAGMRHYRVDTQTISGISDASPAPGGIRQGLWLLPERQRGVLSLQRHAPWSAASGSMTGNPAAPAVLPTEVVVGSLLGVPDALDTESFEVLSADSWLVGTESQWPARTHDALLMLTRRGPYAEVTGQIDVPYDLWNIRAHSNEGIEGLCSAGGHILVGIESAGSLPNGGRFAPIGRLRIGGDTWTPFFLRLTTQTGKISSLACRLSPNIDPGGAPQAIEVVAIERHFHVGRVLRFFVPREGGERQVLEPTDVFDLAPWLDPLPNFESIAWLDDDSLILISDNSMGVVSGPTEALILPTQSLLPVLPSAP